MSNRGPWIDHFGDNFLWSNATLILKGMAPYGVVALEEMDRACEKLRARQGEADRGKAWFEEWRALGDLIEKRGDEALAKGRNMTAGNYYLRAGNYYYTGERMMQPGEKKAQMRNSLQSGTRASSGAIPTSSSSRCLTRADLARLLHEAAEHRPRPTVVLFNGMDNCKEMSVLFAGVELAFRGFNTLAIDGPGQGETLRLRDIPARYDYEVPGTAAYEYVAERPDVDPAACRDHGLQFRRVLLAARRRLREALCRLRCVGSALHYLASWQKRRDAKKKEPARSPRRTSSCAGCRRRRHGHGMEMRRNSRSPAWQKTSPVRCSSRWRGTTAWSVENAQRLYDAVGSRTRRSRFSPPRKAAPSTPGRQPPGRHRLRRRLAGGEPLILEPRARRAPSS